MKKIFALAAGLLFSLSASAGYVGYKLDGLYSSYIIQHDDDRSIAMYDIRTPWGAYMPYDDRGYLKGNLMSAWNTFDGYGPTNFTARFDAPEDWLSTISVVFTATAIPGIYDYTIANHRDPGIITLMYMQNLDQIPRDLILRGKATVGLVDPELVALIDAQGGYAWDTKKIIPTLPAGTGEVPEPASFALIGLGLAGLIRTSRRGKAGSQSDRT